VLLVPWLVGCAGARVVRLDTGEGRPLEYVPAGGDASVEVGEDDFEEALTRLALEVPLTLRPAQTGWLVRASFELKRATDRATTFAELEVAGQRFGRVMGPMSELTSKLVNLDLPCIDPDVKPYYRDVLDHVRRVEVMSAALRDVLTSVFEVSTLLEQQRQGVITRQLASWAAILAVPTAIAGIYGMNFENMPELKTQHGYFVVLAVIATACASLYRAFKRNGWL